jgi:hypothetical protein
MTKQGQEKPSILKKRLYTEESSERDSGRRIRRGTTRVYEKKEICTK